MAKENAVFLRAGHTGLRAVLRRRSLLPGISARRSPGIPFQPLAFHFAAHRPDHHSPGYFSAVSFVRATRGSSGKRLEDSSQCTRSKGWRTDIANRQRGKGKGEKGSL